MSKKPDKKPDKKAVRRPARRGAGVVDLGEGVSAMEPMTVSESSRHRAVLSDKVLQLTRRAAAFRSGLPEGLIEPLSSLVREMNCYYSNLIEGHNTHPVDIQRALFGEQSGDPKKRDLQQEAVAHIEVQRWIDDGGLGAQVATVANLHEIHRRFYEALPESLKWVTNPDTGERVPVIPGKIRRDTVEVGQLISYAMLRNALDTCGLWSVARGLARNADAYKAHLAACDLQRRNDLDGRGNLSEEALVAFTGFFLDLCLDQIDFMEGLMRPRDLAARLMPGLYPGSATTTIDKGA